MDYESMDSLPFSPLPSPTINKLHELRIKEAEEALAQSLFNLAKLKKNKEDEYWDNYYSDSFDSSEYYDRKYKDDLFESSSSDKGSQYTLPYISPEDWDKIEMYKARNKFFKPKPPRFQKTSRTFRPRGKFVQAAQYLKDGRPVNKRGIPVFRKMVYKIGGSSSKKTKTKKQSRRKKQYRTKKIRTKKQSRTKKIRTKKQSRTKKTRTKK